MVITFFFPAEKTSHPDRPPDSIADGHARLMLHPPPPHGPPATAPSSVRSPSPVHGPWSALLLDASQATAGPTRAPYGVDLDRVTEYRRGPPPRRIAW